MERLQKIIAVRGYCARRKAEELIRSGKVKVNGELIQEVGAKAEEDAVIEIEGNLLPVTVTKVVYLLHKPKGVISSAKDNKGRTTVVDLLPSDVRLYPVGRLDFDSSGLILVTNDGELANKLMHPRYEVKKTYEVKTSGCLNDEALQRLREGIDIGDLVTAPAEVILKAKNENKKTSLLEISIHEGHNRQIRRMLEALGYTVLRLHRLAEGPLQLGKLKAGEYRLLKNRELKLLRQRLETENG